MGDVRIPGPDEEITDEAVNDHVDAILTDADLQRESYLAADARARRVIDALRFILDACGAAVEEKNGQLWVSHADGEYGHFVTPDEEPLARFVAALACAPDEVNEAET